MSLLSRPHVPPLYAPGSAPTDTSAPWEPADSGGGGRPPFNPLTDPDLIHLSLALTASDNGTTLTMPDRSPKGTHLTAAGGSGRPSISPTGFCGKSGLDFSSLAGGWAPLTSATAIGALLSGKTAATMIVLRTRGATPAAAQLLCYDTSSPAAGDVRWFTRVPGSAQHQINWYGAPNETVVSPVGGDDPYIEEVTAAVFDAAQAHKVGRIWLDTTQLPGTYAPDVGPASFSNRAFCLGSGNNGASPSKDIIAGLAIVARALTATEVKAWGAWMRQQYGLASRPTRILHAGDSITSGSNTGGYRKRIMDLYRAAIDGSTVKYGSYCPSGNTTTGFFTEDYSSAVGGSRIATVLSRLTTTDLVDGTAFRLPDIIMTMAGTNDIILDGASAATVAASWTSYLTTAYDTYPSAKHKLISLINNTSGGGVFDPIVQAANALGPTAVANAKAARPGLDAEWISSIYTVPLVDGTHPTLGAGGGYEQMGDAYWPLVKGWLAA